MLFSTEELFFSWAEKEERASSEVVTSPQLGKYLITRLNFVDHKPFVKIMNIWNNKINITMIYSAIYREPQIKSRCCDI